MTEKLTDRDREMIALLVEMADGKVELVEEAFRETSRSKGETSYYDLVKYIWDRQKATVPA